MIKQCPYYGGQERQGKSSYIRCGNDRLLIDPDATSPPKEDICIWRNGPGWLGCRAYLVRSIKGKAVNIHSNQSIPELQGIYQKVKNRPGCMDCEYHWYSAGYKNAAPRPEGLNDYESWKQWMENAIPCEPMTHYCRPDPATLYKITEDTQGYCQKQDPEEQEDISMIDTTAISIAPAQEMSPEYRQAIELHNRIVGNVEAAASAMINLCRNLKQMRDTRLYLQLGYESFEDYTEKAIGLKRRQAYNYITVLEKLPSHLLQSNAHLGITKLELLSQVPALDREELLEQNDLYGMTTREVKELVEKVKYQGEQLVFLQEENDRLQAARQELDRIRQIESELEEARRKIADLESRPVEVAVQEPDAQEWERIRREAKEQVEMEWVDKIKDAEKAALEKAEQAAQKREEKARKEAEEAAAARFKPSLALLEQEKARALNRAEELEKNLKASGNQDVVALSLYFGEINKYYEQIACLIRKQQADNPETARKFKAALCSALDQLRQMAEAL